MVVLASASPRRKELVTTFYGSDFTVDVADIDESVHAGESPHGLAARLATQKALAVLDRHPGATVIGADTVVAIDGEMLGKPENEEEALAFLERLSGRIHEVITGVCVATKDDVHTEVVVTHVAFRALTPAEMRAYARSGEGRDKAGGYGIQGGASAFIERVEGSLSNVIGLPIERLLPRLPVT